MAQRTARRANTPSGPEREPLPGPVVPMLARLGPLPRDDDAYGYEIKWDGVRAIAYSEPGRFRLQSRNLNDITEQYPEVRGLSDQLGSRTAVLDGELVAFTPEGRPSFERLQQRMHVGSATEARRRAQRFPVSYVIFDLLHLDGRSLIAAPYAERRRLLAQLALAGDAWQAPEDHRGDGAELLAATGRMGLEGIIAKRLDSPYEAGRRTGAWTKVKHSMRQELVIGGWLPQEGTRNQLGALLVGYHEADDDAHSAPGLRYAGKVGTGWDRREGERLVGLLQPLERRSTPFVGRQPKRGTRFVQPELVAEVEFGEWTLQRMLRHPSYKGLRTDRPAEDVVMESPAGPAPKPRRRASSSPSIASKRADGRKVQVDVGGRTLALSNLDKQMYPSAGFTKGQVIDYYARIAPVLLPHVRERPLTLKRFPDGVGGAYFYEKRCPEHRPPWVSTVPIWTERYRQEMDYCVINDEATIVWLANLADLELHPALARSDALDRPTSMVFDLDPGAPADLLDACQVALWLRGFFDQLELRAFVKASGGKGLHLFVPLNGEASYEEVSRFARQIAETVEKRFPERVISAQPKAERRGKVLIDWGQNAAHKTTVSVYSLRARDRPTVSMPLEWHEVERALEEGRRELVVFEAEEALARVEERGDLFAPVLSLEQEPPAHG